MKPVIRFASLVFGLALLFAAARPGSTAEASTFDRLQQQGWVLVSPNVLQRPMGSGKVETIGFGVEGLEFKIAGMKKDLASFKESLRQNPDPQLRRTVQAYRAEIKRLTKNLALMAEAAQVTTKAGIDCTINYGAHADAFPLGNGTQGVAASADSYFNNNCPEHDQQGEVWVTTTSKASNASGVLTQSSKTDPADGVSAPYSGFDVRAASSTSVAGLAQCFSYAYASMTSYSVGVVYEQRAENRRCPPTVSINGPTSATIPYGSCTTLTYTASVSGGTPPYTYGWAIFPYIPTATRIESEVGKNSNVYSVTLCGKTQASSETLWVYLVVNGNSVEQRSEAAIPVKITVP